MIFSLLTFFLNNTGSKIEKNQYIYCYISYQYLYEQIYTMIQH